MYLRSGTQIHVDVIHARDWFEQIGVPTAGTRLEMILKYFDELLNPTSSDSNPLGANPTEANTYYALNDGAGFGLIASEMSKLPSHLLPKLALKDILQGPLAASGDVTSNSDSRNKFVELELAANLSAAGFKLLGFDDVKVEFEGHNYLIECKRPTRAGTTLDANVEKAYSQLQAKLGDSSERGIVAIAVEKVFGLENRIHLFESDTSATNFAKKLTGQLYGSVRKYERTWVDPRVVGVLAIVRFLMKSKEDSELIASNYILGLLKFASARVGQKSESDRLDRMVGKLQQKFRQAHG